MNLHSGYIALLLVLGFASCSSYGPNADYYYPVDDLADGMVYSYESVGAIQQPPHYWFYRSIETLDSTVLTSTFYSADFEPRQFVNERIVKSGSLMRDLRLYTPTEGASDAVISDVLAPALFSFEAPDTARILVNSVSFRQNTGQDSSALYTLTRNRKFIADTLFTLSGKLVPSQLWSVRELTEQDSLGVLALESRAIEIYAEGIGLVYRERMYSDGGQEAFRLKGRFSMDSLTRMRDGGAATIGN
ncbi:MAG: hypothetical protein AB8F78_17460 [Saprospiraceae bacterium]